MKKVVVALQMLIFRAVGLQIRPSGGMSEVQLKESRYEQEIHQILQ